MAVPKKRTSVRRKGLRRAGQHHKLYATKPGSCSNCGAPVASHSVCPACGFYKGKQAVAIKVKAEEETTAEQE